MDLVPKFLKHIDLPEHGVGVDGKPQTLTNVILGSDGRVYVVADEFIYIYSQPGNLVDELVPGPEISSMVLVGDKLVVTDHSDEV